MLIGTNGYLKCDNYPNINWTDVEDYYIIDETTDEGKTMAKTVADNYPLVGYTHDGKFVTDVQVIQLEKPQEVEGKKLVLQKNELEQFEYVYVDVTITETQQIATLGQELALLKLANIQKDNVIDSLGKELVTIKLQLMASTTN